MKKIFILAGLALFIQACDTGLEPLRSGFSGTLYFEKAWPEDTDEMMVVASTVFPPAGLNDIIMSEPLPTGRDTLDYTIHTYPQKFAAVGVVWKEKNQPWDVTNIIGIYFPTSDHFTPGEVVIPDRNTMVTGIDIEADLSRARRAVQSAISGTLRARGQWPQDAESVLVAASSSFLPSSLLDITLSMPVEVPFDSVDYTLPLQPGTYFLVGALLLQTGAPIGIESIQGIYEDPVTGNPGFINIPTDTTRLSNIDIVLDFNSRILAGQ